VSFKGLSWEGESLRSSSAFDRKDSDEDFGDAQPRPKQNKKRTNSTKNAEFTILYGTASPPTSYGGYGGNAQESAK